MRFNRSVFVSGILLLSVIFSGCSNSKNETKNETKKTIGVVVGSFKDTWRTSVRNELYEMAGDAVNMDIVSSDNSQEVQNKKVEMLINEKVDTLVVNLVDTSQAAVIIAKAKEANIPLIFFNALPSAEDLKMWDKVYYVGAKGEQSGAMQGQILIDYFKNHGTKDGVIRYVMLKGPADHQDAISRSEFSIKAMKDVGLKVEKVAEDIAMWDRETAQVKLGQIISTYGDNFDCVIANNDDMALGAIDALKEINYFKGNKYIPVVGVDSTGSAINAVKDGTLLGTVLNDAENQGKAIFNLAKVLTDGKVPDKDNFENDIVDSKYIWINYKTITKESVSR